MPHEKRGNIHKMDAETPADTAADTPTDTPALPPCRQAEVFIIKCPRCYREMRLKTLTYTHKCGRSFDPVQRAREQQATAEKAVNIRMALIEKPLERRAQHTTIPTRQKADKKKQVC